MKVSIPTLNHKGLEDQVGEHFGRVPTYTIIDLDTNDVKVIPNTSHHMGGHGDPPEIMAKEKVNVMICQGLGRRAISIFESFGIEVYIGASGTVQDALTLFQQGRLHKATLNSACGKHAFRDHHHKSQV